LSRHDAKSANNDGDEPGNLDEAVPGVVMLWYLGVSSPLGALCDLRGSS